MLRPHLPVPPSSDPAASAAGPGVPPFAATPLRRRGSDRSAVVSAGAAATPGGRSVDGAGAAAGESTTRQSAAAQGPGSAVRWPLPAVVAVLAAGGAAVAAAAAWLFTAVLQLTPVVAAAAAAALALLAAAGPALVVALSRLRMAAPSAVAAGVAPKAAYAPVRDADTGALRRDVFMELAEREWARARRYGTGAGLLVVDLDRAVHLLDSQGLAAADRFLAVLTCQTSPTLRGADLITRLAPTQLGVFLAHADATGALDVAERIRERAETLDSAWPATPGASAGPRPRCTVSVGVAPLRPAHLNLQALLHDAQDAVAAARLAGGNCVRAAPVDSGAAPSPGSWQDDLPARPQ